MRWKDVFNWRAQRERAEAEIHDIASRVKTMSVEEARSLAETLLKDPEKFKLTSLSHPLPEEITGLTREVFLKYGSMWGLESNVDLSEASFGQSELAPNHFRIGYEMDCTELVIRPGSDKIHWLESEDRPGFVLSVSPSIYHYILENHMLSNRNL